MKGLVLVVCCAVPASLAMAQAPRDGMPLREATVDALVEQLAPPPATAAVRSMRNLVPQPQVPAASRQVDLVVNFDLNSADLNKDSRQLLDTLARALSSERLKGIRFQVEGHTDAKGSAGYNLALSLRRAQAVVAYLVASGVVLERLHPVGKGFEVLLMQDKPFAAENRRVRIVTME